jgi:broad-specificity NMP kinase
MAVVLIEGDNGTGKTTISQKFSENGFYVVTDEPAIKELEKQAKTFDVGSKERIDAFIAYNRYCGNEALKYKNSLIVRYWISTVSAVSADGLFSLLTRQYIFRHQRHKLWPGQENIV